MKARYLHLVPFGYEKTVIDSQVIVPALELQNVGISVLIVVLESFSDWWRLMLPGAGHTYRARFRGLHSVLLPRFPRNFLFLNTVFIGLFLLPSIFLKDSLVFHARGLQGAALLIPLKRFFKRLRVICDVRGIEAEEYAYTAADSSDGNLSLAQKVWKLNLETISKKALLRSDLVFCVSKAMMDHLQDWVKTPDRDRWEYVPCAVNTERFSIALSKRDDMRKTLGIQDRIVVVYSGAFRDWQLPRETVAAYKAIRELDKRAFFLCLTPDVTDFSGLLEKEGIGHDDSLVCHAPYHEVENYLVAGDLGFLLRKENPVNAYSCPTKFAEYLACGLFVVTTSAILDVAGLVSREKVGMVLTDLQNEQKTRDELKSSIKSSFATQARIRASVACAKNNFDWNRYTPVIKKWYLELASKP